MLLGKFKIRGHSMEPHIKLGNVVLVSSIPFIFAKPKVGDVIAFRRKDEVFIKRIKNIKGDKYYLIGDNEGDSLDSKSFGWILQQAIIGKVLVY